MNVLMLQDKPVLDDNRVFREAASLAAQHHVMVIEPCSAISPEKEILRGFEVHRSIPAGFFSYRNFRLRNQFAKQVAANYDFDVLHCHDQQMLNLGVLIRKYIQKKILIYDSHELFYGWPLHLVPDAGAWTFLKSKLVRRLEVKRERKNALLADYVITVNDSLAEILNQRFECNRYPVVLRNICTAKTEAKNFNLHLRELFSIQPGQKIVVFMGMYLFRKTLDLENVISQLANKNGVCLIFFCKESSDKDFFIAETKRNGWKNIFFHAFLPYEMITAALRECDVGLVPSWNKKDLSYWLALDNKIFEYVQAGLPMLLTQQPEYMKITAQYQFGICVNPDVPEAYYTGINDLIKNHSFFAANANRAKQELTWEKEQVKLLDLYTAIEKR